MVTRSSQQKPSVLMMTLRVAFCGLVAAACGIPSLNAATEKKDPGLQLLENPPMQTIYRTPPEPETDMELDLREGFRVIDSLEALREAIQQSGQKIRMRPGVYRAKSVDSPLPDLDQEHIFAVNGSGNYFDLRGVVIETPVSVQNTLSGKAHVSDSWHINGDGNTIEGGYFRNVVDMPYPKFRTTENEFEVCGDRNTFLDCIFVIKGSIPYGYTDYYGKGSVRFGRLSKHSFMSIEQARDTKLIGCQVYMQSFGHGIHFHRADGVLIKGCLFSGTLRRTNDIFKEVAGRAVEYGFNIMYRGERPIPRGHVIPLTEDAVRSYGGDKNITVIDTTVERQRGCFQVFSEGDITLENVTVREAGDFSYDLSSGDTGKLVMKNCFSDVAYHPVFNLTRGKRPKKARFEVTILSPAEGVEPTPRTSLGIISGEDCTFILRDGTTRPLPEQVNVLHCGGKRGLVDSTVENYTPAKLILSKNVQGCRIISMGPVEDGGKDNKVEQVHQADH